MLFLAIYARKEFLNWVDLVIGIPMLIALYAFAMWWRDRHYRDSPIRKYFLPAWTVRVIGSILTALMYYAYYEGGDTTAYYLAVQGLFEIITTNPASVFNLLTNNLEHYSPEVQVRLLELLKDDKFMTFFEGQEGFVVRISTFWSLLTFKSYMAISFLNSFLAFAGCWRLFKTFYAAFPHLHKQIALATLFAPSVFFWGTGIVKEPLCLWGLGYMTFASYRIFIERKKLIINSLVFLASVYLLANIKIYIVLAYLPGLFMWIVMTYQGRIKNKTMRRFATPILLGFLVVGGGVFFKLVGSVFQEYAIEAILETAVKSQEYILRTGEAKGGSSYDLGKMEPTVSSALSFLPKGVNVTLFRPYLWEARKAINLPAAGEALINFLLFMYVLFSLGIGKFLKGIFSGPATFFTFTFTIIFAFAVGISTYNFGSLARYKIPCMPFFYLTLALLWDYGRQQKKLLAMKKAARKAARLRAMQAQA